MSLALASRRAALLAPWNKNELWRRAKAVPSLDLRFADNKSLVDATTGLDLVTFTRTSEKYVTNSSGQIVVVPANTPAFDHNPTTGESLGLLVEEQRTNLLVRSEDFGTTWTSFGNTVAINTASAPGDQTTADTLVPNNGQSTSGVTQVVPGGLPDSTVYTFSVFIKFAGLTAFNLQFYNKANTFFGSKNLNPQTGLLSGSEFGGTTSVVAYPNGWYRLILANLNSGTGATAPNARIVCSATGDGASGAYIWGAQLEPGAFPTSYIPTGASAVTRAADVASISGSNFSSWYRQDEGTMFADAVNRETFPGFNVFPYLLQFDDGTNANRANANRASFDWSVLATGYRYNFAVRTGDVTQLEIGPFGLNVAAARMAAAMKTSDFASVISANPSTVYTNTAGTLAGTMSRLRLGIGFGKQFSGHIRRLTFWPARLPNSTLQAITQ